MQISQGAVADRGVADCSVPIYSCSCQLIGCRHWWVAPCHSGAVVLTWWYSCYIVWEAGRWREREYFYSDTLNHAVWCVMCFVLLHRTDQETQVSATPFLRNTCLNLLWRTSHAAALIRWSRDYDAVMHATADIAEFARCGRAVAGDEGLVVTLGGHHVEGCVLRQLPFYQDCVTVALCHHIDGS